MSVQPLTLIRHPEALAVARLDAHAVVPDWAMADAPLVSVSLTRAETSVVCLAEAVPRGVRHEGPFGAFEVIGPLDFGWSGVLSTVLEPLVTSGISPFSVSTFDTDWVLVPLSAVDDAQQALVAAGHEVKEPML